MDRVACCRRAAREAVADVGPAPLQDVLLGEIDEAAMTPAVLALESAAAVDPEADLEGVVAPLAAGVQLIYDGLRLTRQLAHDEPWEPLAEAVGEGGGDATQPEAMSPTESDDDATSLHPRSPAEGDSSQGPIDADLTILAADVLVARGFYLLARTDAAETAVETVRAFGRDQTNRRRPDTDAAALDARLERDVCELAVRTGAAAVDRAPSAELLAFGDALADRSGTAFPPADQWLDSVDPSPADRGPGDGVATDRATSATDP